MRSIASVTAGAAALIASDMRRRASLALIYSSGERRKLSLSCAALYASAKRLKLALNWFQTAFLARISAEVKVARYSHRE